jgi:2-keto-3-deoxy-6-phosphogluconate aldolase
VRELPFELSASRVIAALRVTRPELLPVLAGYLWEAGIGTVELPISTEDAALAVSVLSATPMTVGVGDIVEIAQAEAVIEAGARFVSSPVACHAVVRYCSARGVAAIPVASTQREVGRAWQAGASAVKLDSSLIRRAAHSLPEVPLVATGAIDDRTACDHIRAGACAVVADAWLLADAAARGSLDDFSARARRLVAAVAATSLSR